MLCEAFRRLRFHDLEDYQYVGLGSIYLADIRLVHRSLGICRMFSIVKQIQNNERFKWNKPYSGITMSFGETARRLSDVDFSRPTIIWLDYDDRLIGSIFKDIRDVAHSASHGSVLVVTVNAHPWQSNEDGADMLDQLRTDIGTERIPVQTDLPSLRGWGLAKLYRQIGDRKIRDALSAANGADPDRQMDYKQLFNFKYDDNARMTTFDGVFFDRASDADFRACAFERLKFFRPGVDHFRIRAPKLTLREIAHLEVTSSAWNTMSRTVWST